MAYGYSISARDAAYASYRIASEQAGGYNPYPAQDAVTSSRHAFRQASRNTAVKISRATNGASRNFSAEKSTSVYGSVRKTSSNGKKELLRAMEKQDFSVADMTGEQKKKANFAYTGTTEDKKNGYLDLWGQTAATKSEKEKASASKYNYKDVSGEIQRAKTSAAAGSVVIKAKRRVQEIKRKLAGGSGDAEELAMALTHAKRMERVAKKKQHHLELEELVERKQSALPAETDGGSDMSSDLYEAEEQKLSDAQYELEDEQQKALEQYLEETGLADSAMGDTTAERSEFSAEPASYVMGGLPEPFADLQSYTEDESGFGDTLSDELMSGLSELLDEFGSEEQKALEEMQEQLALMETVDPDMSEEDLKELKMKHRQSERRDIVKADMDYLKNLFEHYEKKREKMLEMAKASMPGQASGAKLMAADAAKPAGAAALKPEASAVSPAQAAAYTSMANPSAGFDVTI